MENSGLCTKSKINFTSPNWTAEMKEEVDNLPEASFSSVLTIGKHLLSHMQKLAPPTVKKSEVTGELIYGENEEPEASFNKLFEPWCDYLTDLIVRNQVDHVGDAHVFTSEVSDQYIKSLKAELFEIKERPKGSPEVQLKPHESVETEADSGVPSEEEGTGRNIAIVNFATSQLREDKFQPKMHLTGLFTGIFYTKNDDWTIYNVLDNNYPSEEEYAKLDCIILSGSSLSVNDNIPQVNRFLQDLKKALKKNHKLKVLGTCFGHQAITKMFGGKVSKKSLITGVEEIQFDEEIVDEVPFIEESEALKEAPVELSEFHSDFVIKVPDNFKVIAQSETCKVESMISDNMKYMSFQFHPEYSCEYIKEFEERTQHYNEERVVTNFSEETEQGSDNHTDSIWQIRKIIRDFIDWEVEEEIEKQKIH